MKFKKLEKSEKDAIHDVLFNLDIIELDQEDQVKKYFKMLPEDIIADGKHWGFSDSVVRDNMYVFFKENVSNII